MTNQKVIDISSWQSTVDFKKVKASGIQGVILRIGLTGYGIQKSKRIDDKFEEYYKNAREAGLGVGGYWYSCAYTEAEAIEEAKKVIEYTKGKKFDYPIYMDVEDGHDTNTAGSSPQNQITIGKELLTKCVIAFCDYLEARDYYVGVYASKYWYQAYLISDKLSKYTKWIAHYTTANPDYSASYGMWQYGSSGSVPGISGPVDMNYCYVDFPSIMKVQGLNGQTPSDNEEVNYRTLYENSLEELKTLKEKLTTIQSLSKF